MARFVTRQEALAVLPALQAFAAFHIERVRHPGAAQLADRLRCGTAGGGAMESWEQDTGRRLPDELDNFWRVLAAFEQLALGGEILPDGTVGSINGTVPQPYPWMLGVAGQALRDRGAHELSGLAEDYCEAARLTRRPHRMQDMHA